MTNFNVESQTARAGRGPPGLPFLQTGKQRPKREKYTVNSMAEGLGASSLILFTNRCIHFHGFLVHGHLPAIFRLWPLAILSI